MNFSKEIMKVANSLKVADVKFDTLSAFVQYCSKNRPPMKFIVMKDYNFEFIASYKNGDWPLAEAIFTGKKFNIGYNVSKEQEKKAKEVIGGTHCILEYVFDDKTNSIVFNDVKWK